MRISFFALSVLALSPLAINSPAAAQEPDPIVIAVGDIDLASGAGRQRLDARVRSAIRHACHTGGRTLADKTAQAQCRHDIRAAVREELALREQRARLAAWRIGGGS